MPGECASRQPVPRLPADLGGEARTPVSVQCELLPDAGVVALVSLVSPYREPCERARMIHEQAGIPFHEVWLSTPLAECERRDPKGLDARARRGEVSGVTGVDDPYEPPQRPDLVVTPPFDRDAVLHGLLERLSAP